MAGNQYDFPTEVLALPSKGLLYPEDSPLRSGQSDVKYMTAKLEQLIDVGIQNGSKIHNAS